MHLIQSTSFEAEKLVDAAKYAGLKAEDFQSVKVFRTDKDILCSNCKYWKHLNKKTELGHSVILGKGVTILFTIHSHLYV